VPVSNRRAGRWQSSGRSVPFSDPELARVLQSESSGIMYYLSPPPDGSVVISVEKCESTASAGDDASVGLSRDTSETCAATPDNASAYSYFFFKTIFEDTLIPVFNEASFPPRMSSDIINHQVTIEAQFGPGRG
jgi:hypothetical protein